MAIGIIIGLLIASIIIMLESRYQNARIVKRIEHLANEHPRASILHEEEDRKKALYSHLGVTPVNLEEDVDD